MKLSFLDWVSLIANIVTILGISGFLTSYINKKREEKKTSNEVLANAIKSASLNLNLYKLDDKKIYRVTDYIKYLQDNLKEWKENITNFEIETDWQESEEYFLPSEEELFGGSSASISDSDDYSTDYVFHDLEDQQWLSENQMSEYLNHFKKFSENERENILRMAISRDILSQHLINIEGDSRLSEEELSKFIDSILVSITSEGLSYNSYLNKEFESLLEIQTELDDLLRYQELYVETIFPYVVRLDYPFVILQDKWRSENDLPIEFSTEEYSTRRIAIVDKILSLFENLEKSLPK